MSPPASIAVAFRQLLMARAPLAAGATFTDETALGAGGLGLDSIAMAELLLDCGDLCGIAPPVALLAAPGLTVGQVIAGLRRAVAE